MVHDRIELSDGEAEVMGDGVFIILQAFEGQNQSVVLSYEDLEKLMTWEPENSPKQ
jgi:hypothetical protein